MSFEIDLGNAPAGYILSAARAGEVAEVQFTEFTSTEDGQHFIQRLEGLPSDFLRKISPEIDPSQVDSMLAIVRRDGKATVYVNELAQRARVRASRPVRGGERLLKSDIIDVDRLELGVQIPDDAGVVFVFSVGWRKGLFYDFGPIGGPDPQPRQYDISTMFGQAYCHVLFQERFSITDTEWDALFAAKWFPFAGLRHETIDTLVSYVRSGWEPDERLEELLSEVKGSVSSMLDNWRKHPAFEPHMEILERAIERFHDDDFVSSTSLLYPRIEGIMRTHHRGLRTSNRPSPDNLSQSAVAAKIENEKCLLLPRRFDAYLRDVYFAGFNPNAQDIGVSRNSVAHGVATASEFNQKSALIAILVVHQLYLFLPIQRIEQATAAEPVDATAGE